MSNTIVLGTLIILVMCGFIWQVRNWHDCSEAGGEFVRTMTGTYKCVEVNK